MKLSIREEILKGQDRLDWITFISKFAKVRFNDYVKRVKEDFVPVLDILDEINSDFYYSPDGALIEDLENLLKRYRKQLRYLEKEDSYTKLGEMLYKFGNDINHEIEFWMELQDISID